MTDLRERVQASTVAIEEWVATVQKREGEYYAHFYYDCTIDDNGLIEEVKASNHEYWARLTPMSDLEDLRGFIQIKVGIFVITKIKADESIEVFMSSTQNKEVIDLAIADTQSEIIDQLLHSEDSAYSDDQKTLEAGGIATWCESSYLPISILDLYDR